MVEIEKLRSFLPVLSEAFLTRREDLRRRGGRRFPLEKMLISRGNADREEAARIPHEIYESPPRGRFTAGCVFRGTAGVNCRNVFVEAALFSAVRESPTLGGSNAGNCTKDGVFV